MGSPVRLDRLDLTWVQKESARRLKGRFKIKPVGESKGRWNFVLGHAHAVMSVYSDRRIRTVPPTNTGFRYVPTTVSRVQR
jgi:hypothetical protein